MSSEFTDAFTKIDIEGTFDRGSWEGRGRGWGKSHILGSEPARSYLLTTFPKLKLHSRSTITVTDYKTKHGTRLDGYEIRDQTMPLDGDEHFFHLGKYEPGFRLVGNYLSSTLCALFDKNCQVILEPCCNLRLSFIKRTQR